MLPPLYMSARLTSISESDVGPLRTWFPGSMRQRDKGVDYEAERDTTYVHHRRNSGTCRRGSNVATGHPRGLSDHPACD